MAAERGGQGLEVRDLGGRGEASLEVTGVSCRTDSPVPSTVPGREQTLESYLLSE